MSARDVTRAQQMKYAHYSVERRDPIGFPEITESGANLMRVIVDFRRIPSTSTFVWRPRFGISDTELQVAERWALALPKGGWAQHGEYWFKHRMANGCWFWTQRCGVSIDESLDRFSVWEAEMASGSSEVLS